MMNLCDTINNLCQQQTDISFDDILKSSNSILGKLYQLFLSLKDQQTHLLDPIKFDKFIRNKTEGNLIIKSNKHPMNFIQFIKQIDFLAKENEISKEYLYQKLLHSTFIDNNPNQSNNALDSSMINDKHLLNEYNTDFDRLYKYFIAHSESNEHQMSCSTFVKCICRNMRMNSIEYGLQLNDIFNRIYSSFVNQGIYIPASHKIDFHGFLLCLQQIARLFHFNLRALVKILINSRN